MFGTGGHPLGSSPQQSGLSCSSAALSPLVESGSRSLYLAVVRPSPLTSPVPPSPLSSCQAQWVRLWIWMDLDGSHPTRIHRGNLVPFQCVPSEHLGEHQIVFWRSCCELGTRRSWEGTIKRQNASTWPASRQSTLERHRKKPATIFTKQHVHDVHENVWMHERHGPAGPP